MLGLPIDSSIDQKIHFCKGTLLVFIFIAFKIWDLVIEEYLHMRPARKRCQTFESYHAAVSDPYWGLDEGGQTGLRQKEELTLKSF